MGALGFLVLPRFELVNVFPLSPTWIYWVEGFHFIYQQKIKKKEKYPSWMLENVKTDGTTTYVVL